MNRIKLVLKSLMLGWLVVALGLCSCNSSKTSESGQTDVDSFVATDDNTGTITLTALTSPLAVGSTGKFRVTVLDMNGTPVPQMDISCDSEKEIAIVEPSLGNELTDAWGNMSGVYGCVAEGSFQLACRLPLGANKRKFVTIVCQGDAPEDFVGWPDAAGGTLGGGVAEDPSEDDGGAFGVRVSNLKFDDGPNDDTFSIDVVQDVCDATATPVVNEFFTDSTVKFTVVNDSNVIVRFNRYSYTVRDFDGAGNTHVSPSLSLIGDSEVSLDANGGETTFSAIFMDANGGGKRYYGRSENISGGGLGFKNIKFTLHGVTAAGDPIKLTASTSLSMGNFDNCN